MKGKIKEYIDLSERLKKLESELNFIYIVAGFDSKSKSIQQLQMTFLWNHGFALVDPNAFLVDQPAIKYAAPEKMLKKQFEVIRLNAVKIEGDILSGKFESLKNYTVS